MFKAVQQFDAIFRRACAAVVWLISAAGAFAAVEVEAPAKISAAAAGEKLNARLKLRNMGDEPAEVQIAARLYQMSSASLMPLEEARPWWKGTLKPKETQEADFDFAVPELRGPTLYRVQFTDPAWGAIGKMDVIALPRGWFAEQVASLRSTPIVLHDPQQRFAPALKSASVPFVLAGSSTAPGGGAGIHCLAPDANTTAPSAAAVIRIVETGGVPTQASLDAADMLALRQSVPAQFRFIEAVRTAIRQKERGAVSK